MAKETKANKAPGMFAQFGEQIRFLRGVDPKAVPVAILIGVGTFIAIALVGAVLTNLSFLGTIIWAILGLVAGYLSALLTLTNRANKAIFKNSEAMV